MNMKVRFIDGNLDPIKEISFRVQGETEGWSGALETSAFVHREETVVAPPGSKGLWIVHQFGRPPKCRGHLRDHQPGRDPAAGQRPASRGILGWGPASKGEQIGSEWVPADWMRNGLRIGMARIT